MVKPVMTFSIFVHFIEKANIDCNGTDEIHIFIDEMHIKIFFKPQNLEISYEFDQTKPLKIRLLWNTYSLRCGLH